MFTKIGHRTRSVKYGEIIVTGSQYGEIIVTGSENRSERVTVTGHNTDKIHKIWTVPTWWSRWRNTQSTVGINSLCPCNKSTVLTNIQFYRVDSEQPQHTQSAPVTHAVLTIGHEWNRTQFPWITQHTDVYPRQPIHQSVGQLFHNPRSPLLCLLLPCMSHNLTFNMDINKTQVGHYCFHSQLCLGVHTFIIKGKTSTHFRCIPNT